jgi:hypothetical protein
MMKFANRSGYKNKVNAAVLEKVREIRQIATGKFGQLSDQEKLGIFFPASSYESLVYNFFTRKFAQGAEFPAGKLSGRGLSLFTKVGELARFLNEYLLIRSSGLVNREWYKEVYPDVAEAGIDPVFHYARFGWREGRHPNPFFENSHP